MALLWIHPPREAISSPGEFKRESAGAKAERIMAAELKRRHWTECELERSAKSAPEKLALAARLRPETAPTLPWISARLPPGTRIE